MKARSSQRSAGRRPGCPLVAASGLAFTLIEILLAIAIFMGVVAAIYSSWNAIVRSSRVGLAAAADAQRNRIAMQTIEEALVAAQMSSVRPDHYAFLTDSADDLAELSFVSHLPPSFPRGGRFGDQAIRRVTFRVEADATGMPCLTLRQTPVLFEPDRNEEENPLVLARNVRLFALEFWGPGSREWEPEWLSTNRLPLLIRASLACAAPGQSRVNAADVVARVVTLSATNAPTAVGGTRQPGLGPGTNRPPGGVPGPGTPRPPTRRSRG